MLFNLKKIMDNKFCVYLYKRKDTDIVYYIGQGTNKRAYDINGHNRFVRAEHKKYGTDVELYKTNLTKEDALEIEEELIKHYVYDLNYGIRVKGHYKENGNNLANCTFGKEWFAIQAGKLTIGENNPAKRDDVRKKLSEHAKNHNSFALEEVRKKDSERMKIFSNTKEQKEIVSQRMKAFYQTEKGKARREEQKNINKKYWQEHREEQIQKLKDYFKTEKGKKQIEKHREMMCGRTPSNANGVICVETQETYKSMKELSLLLNKNKHYIAWHFNNKLREDNTIEINIDGVVRHYRKT